LIGEAQVGKSSITCQYIFTKHSPHYIKTIEDFYTARVKVDNFFFEIDILDTAGSDEF
jgi:GTPase SAR1 family protein